MKTQLTLIIIFSVLIVNCKKDNDSASLTSITISKNFIEINGDKRIIDATNENVLFEYGTWGEPGYEFSLTDKQFSSGIAGLPNNNLHISIQIWDINLTKSSYVIVDTSVNQPIGYAEAYMELSKTNGAILNRFRSKVNSGSVKYSLLNSIKTVEFSNIKLVDDGGTSYTVSGRMEFYGYPHNTHW